MRGLIFLFILLTLGFFSLPSCNSANRTKANISSIDSFSYHVQILDSFAKHEPWNTSEICANSVNYMERLTGISAHPDGNIIGWMPFNGKDLYDWKEWYKRDKK